MPNIGPQRTDGRADLVGRARHSLNSDEPLVMRPAMSTESTETDVAILGAGLAGSIAAHALAAQGHDVLLVDCAAPLADPLQAEKIEPDQATLLRSLGLLDERVPAADPIGVVRNYDGHGIEEFDTVEQYGISYHDTVARIRELAENRARLVTAEVRWIRPDPVRPHVGLSDGREVSARLVVVATDGSGEIPEGLALSRVVDESLCSLSYGFDLRGLDPDFTGYNHFLGKNPDRVDFLTAFRVGDRVRAHVHTQQDPSDPAVSEAIASMDQALDSWFPDLGAHLGAARTASPVQVLSRTYRRIRDAGAVDGVVIIGEEFQTVSPTTGMGLTRILTDVKVLCERHAPRWLAGSRSEVRAFYGDPEKLGVDRMAHDHWRYYRDRQTWDRVPLYIRALRKARDIGLGRQE
jgi:2-polyprenyl-6-methoxyphenol hydroxylase-like FAD-dependent oxidoreductase